MDQAFQPAPQSFFDYEKSRIQRSLSSLKQKEKELRSLHKEGKADREWLFYQLLDLQKKLDLLEIRFAVLCEQGEEMQ
jgi:hypothetical protein